MTTAIDTPPADPKAAALDLLVQAAETATGSTAYRAVLQDLAGALPAEGTFAGLAWVDARLVAAAVSSCRCGACRSRPALRRTRRHRPALDGAATVLDGMWAAACCASPPKLGHVAPKECRCAYLASLISGLG